MYVKIDRNVCNHHISKCERCLGKFLTNPYGYERQCFEVVEEDGSEKITLDITSGNNKYFLSLNEEQRLMLAGEGWAAVLERSDLL